jgi:tetrahydromethanopterin S-methyltransferase subunit B
VVVAYEKIPKTAQRTELMVTEKIDQIVQTIDQYQQEIENLWEQLTPTTPPEVKEQRKQEATMQIKEIERQVHAVDRLVRESNTTLDEAGRGSTGPSSGTRKKKG